MIYLLLAYITGSSCLTNILRKGAFTMLKSKFYIAAAVLSLLMLTACADNTNTAEVTETSVTAETTASLTETTVTDTAAPEAPESIIQSLINNAEPPQIVITDNFVGVVYRDRIQIIKI